MAGPYYVRSTDGSDASDGLSWANAKATLVGALALAAAGERIWVSQVHAESQASNMGLISAGTINAPVEIFCGNDATEPPTAPTTGATITTTGTNGIALSAAGHTVLDGLRFIGGSIDLQDEWTRALHCTFELGVGAGSGGYIATERYAELIECHLVFSHASQQYFANGTVEVMGGSVALTGTVPGNAAQADTGGRTRFLGVDMSAFGSGKALLGVNSPALSSHTFEQCKVGAGVALTTGANGGHVTAFLDNSDSADTQYRMQRHSPEGDVYSEIVVIREGGARNQKTQPISHKMVSSAGRTFHRPLYGPDLGKRNTATGSSKTVSVEILHDSVTPLTDGEVWLEVEYLGTSGFPLALFAKDRKADVLATPANQTSSVAAWVTTGLTNPMKQKLEVPFTAQAVGLIRCRVALAKPSYTVYVDPKVTVS